MFRNLFDCLYRCLTDYMGRSGLILYGGSGNSTPPPDPELVDAQIEALGVQNQAAHQIMANASALLPHQIAQMKFGLKAAETAYRDSREDRAYSLERRGHLTGLQNAMINEAKDFNTQAKQEEYAARGIADTETMVAASEQSAARDLSRRGVNPASGAALAQGNASSLAKAGIKVSAANAGRSQARDEGRALGDRAANVLAGYPAMGMNSTQNSMANGMAGLSVANQAVGGIASGFGAAASAAGGAGSTAAQLYGTQAGIYNNAQNAASQEQAGQYAAVGTVVGAAAIAF